MSRHLIGILLLALGLLASASPLQAAGFRLGAQLSAGNNSLTGDLPEEGSWQGQSVLGAGLVAEWAITPDLALSFQPAYAPRDAQQVFTDERDEIVREIDYDITYLSLPLIVRVTGDPVGIRGFVTAGVDLGILLDASRTDSDASGSEDIQDGFNSTSTGAMFGAGAMFPISKHFLTVEFRYLQGLDDILKRDEASDPEGEIFSSPSVKYRGFQLLVGFLFSLGGGEGR